jgi:transposase
MYRKIASEEEELAQLEQITEAQIKKYSAHFSVTAEKDGKKFSYERNHSAIDKLVSDLGYFCLLTNDALSSEEVLSIYRRKDTIEKTFDEIKNHIDMKRLRTHNQKTTEGKIFCAFLALIARMRIENVLSGWMKDHYYSTERVLKELARIRSVTVSDGRRLLNPVTKTQREILAAFNITPEDVLAYVVS